MASEFEGYRCRVNAAVVASEYKGYRYRVNAAEGRRQLSSEYKGYRYRVNAAEGRRQLRANMKAIAVGSMRPKAADSGERISVGVSSGSVRLGIIGNRGIADISCPL